MTINLTEIAVRLRANVNYDEYAAFKKFAKLLEINSGTFVGGTIGPWSTFSHDEFSRICSLYSTAYVNKHNVLVLSDESFPADKKIANLKTLQTIVDEYRVVPWSIAKSKNVDHGLAEKLEEISTDDLIDLIKKAKKELTKRTEDVL